MNKKQKKVLIRIIITAVLLVVLHFIPVAGIPRLLLYLIPYFVIGYDILRKSVHGIVNGQVFDECFLMAIATVGAFVIAVVNGSGDYNEAVAVMLFYQTGELFQSIAVGKSRKSISELMDIRPDYANLETDEGIVQTDPDEVETGAVIVVNPGEKIPIDGTVIEGSGTLNTAALTGESLPRDVAVGDEVISGSINMSSVLRIRTTKEFGESTASKILQEIGIGKVHHQIRKILHSRSVHIGAAAGDPPTRCEHHRRQCSAVGNMDVQSAHISCNKLPLCACDKHPPELLRRAGRCIPQGHTHQRRQLP